MEPKLVSAPVAPQEFTTRNESGRMARTAISVHAAYKICEVRKNTMVKNPNKKKAL